MGDLSTVDGRDKPIGDGADRLIEVRLGCQDVDHSLRRYWDVVGGEGCEVSSIGDWVEWDGKTR